jgi:hypothetical protein
MASPEPARSTSDLDQLVGRNLVDRYRIDELLGMGAMGAVFRGHQLTLHRDVAIKILHPELMQDPQIARRFEREAHSAARLEHPNIVQVLEQGATDDGWKFIVMQLLDGGELAGRLGAPLPPALAAIWAIQIFGALEHAHANGVIHRDLKPENVFVTHDHEGREIVKLVDFGIAKLVGGPSDTPEPMTKLGLVFGTPAYMSPEQATGVEIDARTDLYSAGIILYEMLAGAPPFQSTDPVALIRMQVAVDPPPLPASVPPALAAIVTRLLAKQRDERYASATEVREDLEAVLPTLDLEGIAIPSGTIRDSSGVVGLSSGARPAARSGPVAGPTGRGRWLLAGAILLVIGLAAAGLALSPGATPDPAAEAGAAARPGDATASGPASESPVADALPEIDRLLLAKNGEAALELLAPLRERFPDDPGLAWREGRGLALKRATRETALMRYGEAVAADPTLIENAEFYTELNELLTDRRLRDSAVDFAVERLGKRGHKFLLGLVNERDPDRALRYAQRQRVLAQLRADPESHAVIDHQLNLARDLWQSAQASAPCAAFDDALLAVSIAPAPLYLATLRARAVPKAGPEPDASRCVGLTERRERVLAAFEAAYGSAPGAGEATAEGEPPPAEGEKATPADAPKPKPKPKPKKKAAPAKRETALDKLDRRMEKLFGGG